MGTTRFGVGILGEHSIGEMVDLFHLVEELGYDTLWLADERFYRETYATLALAAVNTKRVKLGTAVTNPYSRHPALTAQAMATVDEISGGRTLLGIGAGGSNHAQLLVERKSPVTALRESVHVFRGMVAGETVDLDGKVIKVKRGRLDFKPIRPAIPVYVGARGPEILKLTGEIGDGVIIGGFATSPGLRYALGQVEQGAAKAGRTLDEIDSVAWVYTSISDDPDLARAAVRKLVVISLINSRPILAKIGIYPSGLFGERLEALGWSQEPEALAELVSLVPDEIVSQFSAAGTPEQVAQTIRGIQAAGVKQVAILPFATPHDSKADIIRRFMTEVVTQLS